MLWCECYHPLIYFVSSLGYRVKEFREGSIFHILGDHGLLATFIFTEDALELLIPNLLNVAFTEFNDPGLLPRIKTLLAEANVTASYRRPGYE